MGCMDISRLVWRIILSYVAIAGAEVIAAPRLSLTRDTEYGWHRVAGTAEAARVYTVHASSNLVAWKSIATLIDLSGLPPTASTNFYFLDPASPLLSQRFYRAT